MSTPSESVDAVIGRVVESVWVSRDRYELAMVFADGSCHVWFTNMDGSIGNDCECWIEHVDNFDFKGTIRGAMTSKGTIESLAPPGVDTDQEFITFHTERGRLIIDLRTRDNGYYGGSLGEGSDRPMSGDGWVEVT